MTGNTETTGASERPVRVEGDVMPRRSYWDEEDWLATETKDYRMGTLTIYGAPKARRKKPKYGYKFVETD